MASSSRHSNRQNRRYEGPIKAPFDIQVPSSLRDPTRTNDSIQELSSLKNDDHARTFALQYVHNHEQFAQVWNSDTIRPYTRKLMRKLVQAQTVNAVCNGFYRLPDGTKINLDKRRMHTAATRTRQYANDFAYNQSLRQKESEQSTEFFVVNADCLDTVWIFKEKYPQSNPVILNMASRRNPGGGWKNGAGAQEENLHRRTNLFQCLEDPYHDLAGERQWEYHVPEFGGIYTPDACVFRGSETDGYPFFADGPKYLSFIACSAYSHPPTEDDKDGELILCGKNVIENTRRKIQAILNIACENKHDIVILSAFGCGAFQNPPKHIAQLFKEVITQQFNNVFKCIVFAIIDDHNSRKTHNPMGNVQPFANVFQTDILTFETLHEKLSQ